MLCFLSGSRVSPPRLLFRRVCPPVLQQTGELRQKGLGFGREGWARWRRAACRTHHLHTMMEGLHMQQGHDYLRAPPGPPPSAAAAAAAAAAPGAGAEFGRPNVIFDGACRKIIVKNKFAQFGRICWKL